MNKILVIFLSLFMAMPALAAKKKNFLDLNKEPYENLVAEAAMNHTKRLETIGGMVRWLDNFLPAKDVKAVKKWMMENNVPENQFVPEMRVSGSTITIGRDQLTIHKDHFVLNKKKFKYKTQSLAQSLGQFCTVLDCFNQKTSQIENPLFPKAHAIFGFITGKFILGFVAGVLLAKPVKKFFRRIFRGKRRGDVYTREEAVHRNNGESYQCHNGRVLLIRENGGRVRAYNRESNEAIALPEGALEDGRSCEENARAINRLVAENERRGNHEAPDGFRSVTGEKQPTKPIKGK